MGEEAVGSTSVVSKNPCRTKEGKKLELLV